MFPNSHLAGHPTILPIKESSYKNVWSLAKLADEENQSVWSTASRRLWTRTVHTAEDCRKCVVGAQRTRLNHPPSLRKQLVFLHAGFWSADPIELDAKKRLQDFEHRKPKSNGSCQLGAILFLQEQLGLRPTERPEAGHVRRAPRHFHAFLPSYTWQLNSQRSWFQHRLPGNPLLDLLAFPKVLRWYYSWVEEKGLADSTTLLSQRYTAKQAAWNSSILACTLACTKRKKEFNWAKLYRYFFFKYLFLIHTYRWLFHALCTEVACAIGDTLISRHLDTSLKSYWPDDMTEAMPTEWGLQVWQFNHDKCAMMWTRAARLGLWTAGSGMWP